jgi:hypothetical protein
MSEWIPPGYVSVVALVREHGVEKVRSDLFSAHLEAFEWDKFRGGLDPIKPRDWCARDAEQLLQTGTTLERSNYPEDTPRRRMILVRLDEQPKPQPSTDGVYLPPFMQLMLEAVQHFKIGERQWPKKEELEQYFRAQKLPDGTPVSANQAGHLATFVRPLAAMSGGNKG